VEDVCVERVVQNLREIAAKIEKLGKTIDEIEEILERKVTITKLERFDMPPIEVSMPLKKPIGNTFYAKLYSILKGRARELVASKVTLERGLSMLYISLAIAEKGELVETHLIDLSPGDEVEASIGDIIAFTTLEEEDWRKLREALDEKEKEWSAALETLKGVVAALKLVLA